MERQDSLCTQRGHVTGDAECPFYRVPEHRNHHSKLCPLHALCAVNLQCSGTR